MAEDKEARGERVDVQKSLTGSMSHRDLTVNDQAEGQPVDAQGNAADPQPGGLSQADGASSEAQISGDSGSAADSTTE